MPEDKSSNRWVWIAGGVAIALVALAGLTAALWPEIELRYHRHYFRKGADVQKIKALSWMCNNRFEEGMSKEAVEHILGEPLEKRFEQWTFSMVQSGPEIEQPMGLSVPVFRFRGQALISDVNLYLDLNGEVLVRTEGDYVRMKLEMYEAALKRVAPDSIDEYFRRYNRRRRERREAGAETSP